MNRVIKLLIVLAISALCVWVSMKGVDLQKVLTALKGANYFGFAAVCVVTIFGFWIRAVRWRSFIVSPKPLRTDALFSATMIGFMANNVLPFRLGEFVRPWALARSEGLSKTTLLATVVVERAIDMLTLLAILGIALAVHPLSSSSEAANMVQQGAGWLVGLSVALTLFVVVMERQPKLAHALIGRLTSVLPEALRNKVRRALDHFLEGLGLFRDLPRLLWVFFLSFLMFFTFSFGLSISMWSLGLDVAWYAGLLMLVITAIGIMIPGAPGYIGTLNLACIAGLALFGVSKDLAASFSWFYFFSQWLPITVVGLFYLNREGLSLKSLGQAQEGAA